MNAVTRSFSMEIVSRSDRLRRRAVTAQQWAEVQRLEDCAVRAFELEAVGERILSAVMPAEADPLAIPSVLRRA
jgi:hypothetical protein